MLIKLGVSIQRLKRPMRRALKIIDTVYRDFGEEAVLTSADEGDHSPSSLHYANLACDFRLIRDMVSRESLLVKLKIKLGVDYDVVAEKNHLHIEHDP